MESVVLWSVWAPLGLLGPETLIVRHQKVSDGSRCPVPSSRNGAC